jgi:outer membrane protein OmpA-like peptidoglycan-associated protein
MSRGYTMNRNWHRRAAGRIPILSTALLAAGGLLWNGTWSNASAQTYSGASNEVIVNYDVLNALSGQPAPNGGEGVQAGTPPSSQFAPGAAPNPYAPNGASPMLPAYSPYGAYQPGVAGPLAAPPAGTPSSVLTALGPDGRPITPFVLKKPGSGTQSAQPSARVAAVTPPAEPAEVPAQVPMPEATPAAPEPAVNAETLPAAPTVETPAPPAEAATPAETPTEQPAAEQPAAEQPAEEQPAQEQASQEQPAPEAPAEATPPAEGEAASAAPEEAPSEEAAAETPPEPNNSQPAPPIPQGGIRIVFPTELNEVPGEANAALDDLATQMQADENMRIQIMCYASGTEDTESKARRKSLQRCINIRQYLFKKDIRTTRMDVRALGLKSEGQPADRVDIVPANS